MKSFELVHVEIFDDSLEEMVSSEMLKVTENGKVWWVTPDSSSRRWNEYLEWLAEGNTPEVINNEV